MCGIYGAIGNNIDVSIIRSLALINRERGTDSIGFFDSEKRVIKYADDALYSLSDWEMNDYLALNDRRFLVGHNRNKTRGEATVENAHPFEYGGVIGSHNGIVHAPNHYPVDSMYLIDLLNKYNNDYQSAFQNIGGYWGLVWSFKGELYLQAHKNEIAIGIKNGVYYFSSDYIHLKACIGGYCDSILEKGATIKFNESGKLIDLPDFKSAYQESKVVWKNKNKKEANWKEVFKGGKTGAVERLFGEYDFTGEEYTQGFNDTDNEALHFVSGCDLATDCRSCQFYDYCLEEEGKELYQEYKQLVC